MILALYQRLKLSHFLLLSNVIFITLYLVLSYYNRLAHDDFYSIYTVNENGVMDSIILQYNNWSTRYCALFISFSIASIAHFKYTLFIYQLLIIMLLIASLNSLYKNVSKLSNILPKQTKFRIINLSIFLASIIFYCSFNLGDTWFWLSSSCSYLLSIIALIYLLSMLISNKSSLTTYLSLATCSLFIGGSNGTLSIFYLLLAFIYLLRIVYNSKNAGISTILKKDINRKLIFSSLIIFIGFLILYIGSGNENRSSFFSPISFTTAFIYNFKFCGIIIFKKILPLLFYLITFCLPFYFLGNKTAPTSKHSFIKLFIFSSILLVLSIYIFQLPITYKTQDIGADRTLIPLTLFLIIYFSYNLFQLGNKSQIEFSFKKMGVVFFTLIISINTYHLIKQYSIVKKYANAYDNRIQQIKKDRNKPVLILDPLPASGFLYSAEISENPNHFTNKQLKQGLQIKGTVKLKSN